MSVDYSILSFKPILTVAAVGFRLFQGASVSRVCSPMYLDGRANW